MKNLLLALPFLLAACESTPRFLVAGPDQNVEVLGRQWTVTRVSEEPAYYRAVRNPTEYFLFGPPARTKTSQAILALEKATGCRAIRSSLYREPSDYFIGQVACSDQTEIKWRLDPDPIL